MYHHCWARNLYNVVDSGFIMDDSQLTMFFLPDPLMMHSMISGAVLLYFDGPFFATAPPSVVTSESFSMLDLVSKRKPNWSDKIFSIAGSLKAVNNITKETWESIKSSDPEIFKLAYLAFPANRDAYMRVDNWVAMSGFKYEELKSVVIPPLGDAELARHIFLEQYLEFNGDLELLYEYCEKLLSLDSIESLVIASYLLRLQVLLSIPDGVPVLFTNEALVPFFEKLNAATETEKKVSKDSSGVDSDVVSWEFFRVLVSRIIDPLDVDRLAAITRIRKKCHEQVLRLRSKCKELAPELIEKTSIVGLGDRALKIIEFKLRKDLRDLFELDEKAWRDFKYSLISDRVVWTSLASIIAGLTGSGPMFTSAGIITTLASVGSTAMKVRAARESELKQNDFALLRVLKQSI